MIKQKRPNPFAAPTLPRVLQAKAAAKPQPPTKPVARAPVAPPVYRPQRAGALQPKSASARPSNAAGQQPPRPAAPPVYRPEPKKVVQPKTAAPSQPPRLPKTPPAYRPQPTPKAPQTKESPARAAALVKSSSIQRMEVVARGSYDVSGVAKRDRDAPPQVIGPIGSGGGKRPPDRNLKLLFGHGVDMNPDVDWEAVHEAEAERSRDEKALDLSLKRASRREMEQNYPMLGSRSRSVGTESSGTVVPRRRRVVNLASGTDMATLMRAIRERTVVTDVINFDTGHMAIADVLIANAPDSLLPFLIEIREMVTGGNLNDRLQSCIRKAPTAQMGFDNFLQLHLQQVMQGLLLRYPGSAGARRLYEQMRTPDKYRVVEKLQNVAMRSNDTFKLGDASRLALEPGTLDEIHIVNAYGFDPLNDNAVCQALAAALAPGGLLIITAEATGPSVAPALGEMSKGDVRGSNWGKNGFPGQIPMLTILTYFDYLPGQSTIGERATVFGGHPLTRELSTRHTVGNTDMMSHLPTIRLVFRKK